MTNVFTARCIFGTNLGMVSEKMKLIMEIIKGLIFPCLTASIYRKCSSISGSQFV